jgi:hypothetical protein
VTTGSPLGHHSLTTLGGNFLRFDANYGGAALKKCANALIIRFSACALMQVRWHTKAAVGTYTSYKKVRLIVAG